MPRFAIVLLAMVGLATIAHAEPVRIITIASVSDDSGEPDPGVRKHHSTAVSGALEPAVAAIDAEARRLDLEARQLDVSIGRLDLTSDDAKVYVTTELRLVISDSRGRMLWLLSSCATVEVPANAYRPSRLGRLQDEALENASAGLVESLRLRLLGERRPNA
jgi:hypothetical protein